MLCRCDAPAQAVKETYNMNIKEIGEIRRRVRRDRSNMTAIYGCYVNSQKEIISEFWFDETGAVRIFREKSY